MNGLILASIGAILIVGSLIALWWWRLAAKIAPYRDELDRPSRSARNAPDEPTVVVIPGSRPPNPPRA